MKRMEALILVVWLSASAVVAALAHAKGHSALLYFVLSLFVTPVVTLIVMALMPRRAAAYLGGSQLVACHYCSLPRLVASPVCPHCQAGPIVLQPNFRQCPRCSAKVLARARLCVHCGADLTPQQQRLAPVQPVARPADRAAAAAWQRLES